MASTMITTVLGHTCGECTETYPTIEALRAHKKSRMVQGRGHIHCCVCYRDFMDHASMGLHFKQHHQEKQQLECPGCHKVSARMSTFLAHIIHDECQYLSSAHFFGWRNEMLSFADELAKRNGDVARPGRFLGTINPGDTSLWETNAALRYGLSDSLTSSRPLGAVNTNTNANTAQDEWAHVENLFPGVPAAPKPPANDPLTSLSVPTAKKKYLLSIHDPYHTDFIAAKYYNNFNGLFECPMTGCEVSFHTKGEIVSHLVREGRHGGVKPQCPSCYKMFNHIIALAQHIESPSQKCRIRSTDGFRIFVHQLTGGLIDATGLNPDLSVKFEIAVQTMLSLGPGGKGKLVNIDDHTVEDDKRATVDLENNVNSERQMRMFSKTQQEDYLMW